VVIDSSFVLDVRATVETPANPVDDARGRGADTDDPAIARTPAGPIGGTQDPDGAATDPASLPRFRTGCWPCRTGRSPPLCSPTVNPARTPTSSSSTRAWWSDARVHDPRTDRV